MVSRFLTALLVSTVVAGAAHAGDRGFARPDSSLPAPRPRSLEPSPRAQRLGELRRSLQAIYAAQKPTLDAAGRVRNGPESVRALRTVRATTTRAMIAAVARGLEVPRVAPGKLIVLDGSRALISAAQGDVGAVAPDGTAVRIELTTGGIGTTTLELPPRPGTSNHWKLDLGP